MLKVLIGIHLSITPKKNRILQGHGCKVISLMVNNGDKSMTDSP